MIPNKFKKSLSSMLEELFDQQTSYILDNLYGIIYDQWKNEELLKLNFNEKDLALEIEEIIYKLNDKKRSSIKKMAKMVAKEFCSNLKEFKLMNIQEETKNKDLAEFTNSLNKKQKEIFNKLYGNK